MVNWKILYSDGTTFSEKDGGPKERDEDDRPTLWTLSSSDLPGFARAWPGGDQPWLQINASATEGSLRDQAGSSSMITGKRSPGAASSARTSLGRLARGLGENAALLSWCLGHSCGLPPTVPTGLARAIKALGK
jgi:hypothetical protein